MLYLGFGCGHITQLKIKSTDGLIMFAQMKSRKKSNNPVEDFEKKMKEFAEKEFEKQSADKPFKEKEHDLVPRIIIVAVFSFIGLIVYLSTLDKPGIRYIEVNGQNCHIEYVIDRTNSHSGPVGHDRAVCP